MANSLNRLQMSQIESNFNEALLAYQPRFPKIAKMLGGPAGTVYVGKNAVGGIARTLADSATSSVVDNMHSFQAAFTTLEKYKIHKIPKHKLGNEAGLASVGEELAQVAGKNIDNDGFAMLSGLFAAAHPRAGAAAGQVGAGKLALDTGLKGLQGEGGEFLYDTLLATAALSEVSLSALVQLLLKQMDDRGMPLSLATTGNLALVCSAKNAQIAHELIKSSLSGSDNASNYNNGLFNAGVVIWEQVDDDDYFVIDVDHTPLGYYLARAPSVEVTDDTDTMFSNFVVKWHGVPVYDPYLFGVVGCNVA